jgi:hypothetical protein
MRVVMGSEALALYSTALDFSSPASLVLALVLARLGWMIGTKVAIDLRVRRRFHATRGQTTGASMQLYSSVRGGAPRTMAVARQNPVATRMSLLYPTNRSIPT